MSRRRVLAGAGVGVLGATVGSAATAEGAAQSVRGTWVIEPETASGPAPFQALAAFAAGGVFITTGSDEAGTGLGQWNQRGATGFGFTYLNFHFDGTGAFAKTVKVRARGTFHGSTLTGKATLSTLDADGKRLSPDARFSFKGKRLAVQAP